ncbi:MAG: hypothetical protein LCH63_20565 [Candidatus Melainabacteria bacterium]|nr:hypothetical protein [Candidatus Melainabacteria bacterium]
MTEMVKEQGEQVERQPEAKPSASPDAQAIASPTAREKQSAEADRTNQSSGSIAELALKSRGMSREQVTKLLKEQGDSVSIDYGKGLEASRKTGLTAKDIELKSQEPQEDLRPITPKQVEVGPQVIRAGLDYNVDNQPLSQKLAKFAESAQARLMDPAGRQAYFQGLIDKTLGIGEGLNEAKEEIKSGLSGAAQKAWTGIKDGSVARFLAQPNAINEPLFKTIGTCFDAMRKDPNAVNNVLTIMGRELLEANDKYSQMPPRERGIQDGKAMFYFINPSGSIEAADMAIMAGERVLEPVDKVLVEVVRKSMETAGELAKTSVEAAKETKQMLFDWLKVKGFKPKDMQLVGVPEGYFDGIQPTETLKPADTFNAMSKADDIGSSGKPGDIQSGKPSEIGNEALDNPEGLAELAKKFGISMPPRDTYVFVGEKDAVSAEAAAKRLGLTKEQLAKLDDATLGAQNLERVPDYRDAFFNRHPGLIPVADRIIVHHAIPKWFLKEHPRLFTAKEVNDIESLRGIYKSVNDDLHNDKLHNAWRYFALSNPNPTRSEVLKMVEKLDTKYGRLFIPTEGR